jgi:hypothetical protein
LPGREESQRASSGCARKKTGSPTDAPRHMFSMRKRETGDQPDLFLLRIISLVVSVSVLV